ncbi:MAG: FAD-binding oxidoreductase [Armatimonadota bacterium]
MRIPWTNEYDDYLRDESRRVGAAESISFPKSEAEVIEVLRAPGPVTIQGARTGIVAGAVPPCGHVLNLSWMNGIGEVRDGRITVQPGALLADVRKRVEAAGLFFPPDPTETTASIGGMVACNASGALSYRYGPTRKWVQALRVVLADGSTLAIRRGERARGRDFSLTTEDGRTISGRLPGYAMPSVKSAAGYYVADDMELIDLFIGMEGTLGVITEVELSLAPRPAQVAGLTVFLPSEESALRFVRELRTIPVVAIEYFNADALNLLRETALTDVPAPLPGCAVYTEVHGGVDDAVERVLEILPKVGASDEKTWLAESEREIEALKAFRHAVPESVNLLIDERREENRSIAKLGTDMSVPTSALETAMRMYNEGLAGLDSVIFGHIGDGHMHVNILPKDESEYETGRALYAIWARRVVEMGGSVAAEHGIGKTKAPLLALMYGEEGVAGMRDLKKLFDPEMRLAPGNLFKELT